MEDKQTVTIFPKCKRARERVNQHGKVMILIENGMFKGETAILVESLRFTARDNRKWNGWFTKDEVDWSIH